MYNSALDNVEIDSTDTTGLTYYASIGYRPVHNIEYYPGHIKENPFVMVSSTSLTMISEDFSHAEAMKLFGSNIQLTNLRVFNDVIPTESISNLLNQSIILDADYLILADNANKKIIAENIPNKN